MHSSRVAQLLQKAASHQASGQPARAADLCRQILRTAPRHSDALHLLGICTHQQGNVGEAIQLIAQSLAISPDNLSALGNLATILRDQQQYEQALLFYQSAIALAPDDVPLHSNCGIVLEKLGRYDEAIATLQRAIDLDPRYHAAHCNLGTVFQARRQYGDAMRCYQQALALQPRDPFTFSNIACIHAETGRHADAATFCEQALAIDPGFEAALTVLSAALNGLGRYAESRAACWRAIKVNPRSHLALNNLGIAHQGEGDHARALTYFHTALEFCPTDALTHNNLGLALRDMGDFPGAIEYLKKAVALDPAAPIFIRNLGSICYDAGMAAESIECLRKSHALNPGCPATYSDLLFALNYLPHDPTQLFAEHQRFETLYGTGLTPLPHANSPTINRPLRIGYVSGDFRDHPVAHFIEPLFAHYTRGRFQAFCYDNKPATDSVSTRLRAMVDVWREVDRLDDVQLAALIREDAIDILVDLSGHTTLNRLPVFARRPAPVQVNMIGCMQTTGLSAIDYRITDEVIDPAPAGDAYSSEKLIRLPGGPSSFQFHTGAPEVSPLPALAAGYLTFATFQNLAKVNSLVLATWARVLEALPGSRLIVVAKNAQRVRDELHRHGIDPARVEPLARLPAAQYLALHHRVDLVLDTFPFNGYTTNLISAWMGVPFVTVAGNNTVSRVGESLLRRMGIPDFVAANPAAFVEKTVAIASNLPRLSTIRAGLRPRLQAWTGDHSTYISELESAYHQMWRAWCATQKENQTAPSPFAITLPALTCAAA